MAQPDIHDVLLGQYLRREDRLIEIEDAEPAFYAQALRDFHASALETVAAGGPKLAEMLDDYDYDFANQCDDLPTSQKVLAELAMHIAAGSVDAGIARVMLYLQVVAKAKAEEDAGTATDRWVDRQMREAA